MAEAKRYFWLKLQDGFFGSKRIKKLRKIAGGDTYVIIYLKMQLKSIKTGGLLEYTGLEQDFAAELALDLDEDEDNVRFTLNYLSNTGLIETSDNINFLLPYAVENTGSESAAAQRMREMRERNNVTPLLRDRDADVTPALLDRYGEIEIEKELNIEINKELNKEIDIDESISGESAERGLTDSRIDSQTDSQKTVNYEGLIRVYLRMGNRDAANAMYQDAKRSGILIDVEKIKKEEGLT